MKPYTVIRPQVKIFPHVKVNTSIYQTAWNISLAKQVQKEAISQPKIHVYRPHIIEKKSPKKSQQIHILQPAKISSKGFKIGYKKSQSKSNAQMSNNSQISLQRHEHELKRQEFLKNNEPQQPKNEEFENIKENILPLEESKVNQIVIIRDDQSQEMMKLKIIKLRRALKTFFNKSHSGEEYHEKAEIQAIQEMLVPEQAKEKCKRRLIHQKAAGVVELIQLNELSEQSNNQIFQNHRRLLSQYQKFIPLSNQLIQQKIELALLEQSYCQDSSNHLIRSLSPEFDQKQNIKDQIVIINDMSESIEQKIKSRYVRSLEKDRGVEPVLIPEKEFNIIIKQEIQSLSPNSKNILKRRLADQINQIQPKSNILQQLIIKRSERYAVPIHQEQEFMGQNSRLTSKRNLSHDKKVSNEVHVQAVPLQVNSNNFQEEEFMGENSRLSSKRNLSNNKKIFNKEEQVKQVSYHININNFNEEEFMGQSSSLSKRSLSHDKKIVNKDESVNSVSRHINMNSFHEEEFMGQNSRLSSKRNLSHDKKVSNEVRVQAVPFQVNSDSFHEEEFMGENSRVSSKRNLSHDKKVSNEVHVQAVPLQVNSNSFQEEEFMGENSRLSSKRNLSNEKKLFSKDKQMNELPFHVNMDNFKEEEFMNQNQRFSSKRHFIHNKQINDMLNKNKQANSVSLHFRLDNYQEEEFMSQNSRLSSKRNLSNKKKVNESYVHAVPLHVNIDNFKEEEFMNQNQGLSSKRNLSNNKKVSNEVRVQAVPFQVNSNSFQEEEFMGQNSRLSSKRNLSHDKKVSNEVRVQAVPLQVNSNSFHEEEFMGQNSKLSSKRNLSHDKKIVNKDEPVNSVSHHINMNSFQEEEFMGQSSRLSSKRNLSNEKLFNKDKQMNEFSLHVNMDNFQIEEKFMNENSRLSSKRNLSNDKKVNSVVLKDSEVQIPSINVNLDNLKEQSLQKNRISMKRQLVNDNNDNSILFKSGYQKCNTFQINIDTEVQQINPKSKSPIKRNLQISQFQSNSLKINFHFVPPPLKKSQKWKLPDESDKKMISNQKSSTRFKHIINLPPFEKSKQSITRVKSPSKHVHINSFFIDKTKK